MVMFMPRMVKGNFPPGALTGSAERSPLAANEVPDEVFERNNAGEAPMFIQHRGQTGPRRP